MANAPKVKRTPKPTHVKETIRGLVPSVHYGEQDVEYNAYLNEIDPNGESDTSNQVRRALALSTDVRFKEFLSRLSAPKYKGRSLATIAKSCDIQLPEFAQWWQSAQKMRLLARAQEGLAEVTEGIIAEARSKLEVCGRCDGYGWQYADENIPESHTPQPLANMGGRRIKTCQQCRGEGKVLSNGSNEARKLLMDMTGLSGKKGVSVTVNTNNTFGGMGVESAVERFSSVKFSVMDADFTQVEETESEDND